MAIIINGFHNECYSDFLYLYMKKNSHEKFYLIRDSYHEIETLKVPDDVDFVIIDFIKIQKGDYSGLNITEKPLDYEIFSKIKPELNTLYQMMDRIPDMESFHKRKTLLFSHLKFWNTIFSRETTIRFISSNIPHEVYDYVIHLLSSIYKSEKIYFHQAGTIPDTAFILSDLQENEFCPEINNEYSRLLKNKKTVILSNEYKNYFDKMRSKTGNTPFYMKSAKTPFIKKIIKYMKKPDWKTRLKGRITGITKHGLKKNSLNNFYNTNSVLHQKDENYIYFPLHFQPELTTCPLADFFVDQQFAIELLSCCLPDNWKIFVKEHPKQDLLYRGKEFYESLLSLENVELINRSVDSYNLISGSKAVATCTGTAGWEALFKNKPVLLFGRIFYMYHENVFKACTKKECKIAMDKILVA